LITIKEEIAVPSPRRRVWEVVSNPEDVVSCISGAELGAAHEDGSFDGALVVKFGAIRVRFAARITLELTESEFEGRLSARGGDGQGATRFHGAATFRVVEDAGSGGSRVLMEGELTLSGKLASLVESGAGVVVSRMTKDFTAKLVQKCVGPAVPAAVPALAPVPAGAPIAAGGPAAASPPAAGGTPVPHIPVPHVPAPHSPAPHVAASTGRLRRFGAWLGRLLRRGRPPRPVPGGEAPGTPSHHPTRTEEVGSGNATAQ
jgi:carbon monoxide dehydrogenase subunit G